MFTVNIYRLNIKYRCGSNRRLETNGKYFMQIYCVRPHELFDFVSCRPIIDILHCLWMITILAVSGINNSLFKRKEITIAFKSLFAYEMNASAKSRGIKWEVNIQSSKQPTKLFLNSWPQYMHQHEVMWGTLNAIIYHRIDIPLWRRFVHNQAMTQEISIKVIDFVVWYLISNNFKLCRWYWYIFE